MGKITDDHPPVADGYVRIYEDHTGRWYRDITIEEHEEWQNSDFAKFYNEEVRKEIDAEIVERLKDFNQTTIDSKKL